MLSSLPSFAIFPKFEFNLYKKKQFNDHNNEDFDLRASFQIQIRTPNDF